MVHELAYRLYERRLAAGLRQAALPRHVAVILDGNRRYARARGLSTVSEGHRRGAEKIHELLDWCDELGIPFVTIWLLSTDNLARDEQEMRSLSDIIAATVRRMADEAPARKGGMAITAVGDLDALPGDLARTIKEAEEQTKGGQGLRVQVAVGYGGRQEITDALRGWLEARLEAGESLEQAIASLDEDAISAHLYTNGVPDPDLIIRTSGEIRLSGFLMWQSAHSEFYFCDPYWPEFRKTDFLRALREFGSRSRRFGR
ncbi:MAG TPA: polyprenyl diphosphate synthase [Egibacteraceae bacterium]|nr:polyprenyl diphosphate synthase [Egibacteraceae bacterium]